MQAHIVPRFHLGRFATPPRRNGFIYAINKRTGRPEKVPVKDTCTSKDFYVIEDDAGNQDAILEDMLQKIESYSARRIERLVAQPGVTPPDDERLTLANYLVLTHMRTPWMREQMRWTHDTATLAHFRSTLEGDPPWLRMRAAVFPDMTDEEAEEFRQKAIADLDSGSMSIAFPERHYVISTFQYQTDLAYTIAGMSWTVMRAPAGSEYVIGDHAVSMYDPLVGAPGHSTGNGFASSPLAETVLPFDRSVAVKLSLGEDEDWRDIDRPTRLRAGGAPVPLPAQPAQAGPRQARARGWSVRDACPGPWLRLTAVAASAALLLAVVSGVLGLGTAHRLLAALALPPLVALVCAAWLCHRRLLVPALVSLAFFVAAALSAGRPAHIVLAALALSASLWLAAASHRAGRARFGSVRDYVTLTKPRIMVLLLVTGAGGLVAGAHGLPRAGLALSALGGLALACGGASALNHVLDRDLDRLLGERTRSRPVASGRVPPAHALEFGLCLSALSFTLLASTVNVLAAALALVGNLFYVLVYTRWLKRSTPQNIVIGGAAGAVPPLVGWAAATGNVALPALLLFLIVFLWTPPHFWALALLIKRDYAAARVPMLPVVSGEGETARQIVRYAALLVACTIVPYAVGAFGVLYLGAALLLGCVFLWLALRLRNETTPVRAARLFHYSLLYLALLFAAVALDAVV